MKVIRGFSGKNRADFFMVFLVRTVLVLLLNFTLSACQIELYTGLSEKEGNEMLSILLMSGIDVEKISQKKGNLVTLTVEKDDLSRSINLLKSQGFPRDEFASVGELFKKEGLISSPLEERVRYIYGLSQEISSTLSQLDGVITARVHIVIPEVKDKRAPIEVSSASVFLKYTENTKLDDFVPQIKMLVNNSIEGLHYDNISVALFPSQPLLPDSHANMKTLWSMDVAAGSLGRLYTIVGTLLILLFLSVAGNGWFLLTLRKRQEMSLAVQ